MKATADAEIIDIEISLFTGFRFQLEENFIFQIGQFQIWFICQWMLLV